MEFSHFLLDASLALVLGAVVGVERQVRQHPAGLRTNALVCLGAAVFVSVSRLAGDTNSPTRVASYVVSGVGFLGGGVILREGLTVKGIDTAATLWCTAAVGVLAGSGFPGHAGAAAGLVLLVNLFGRPIAQRLDAGARAANGDTTYQVQLRCQGKRREAVRDELLRRVAAHPGLVVQGVVVRVSKRRKRAAVVAEVHSPARNDRAIEGLVSQIGLRPDVSAAEWEIVTGQSA